MNNIVKPNKEYDEWITEIESRFKKSRIKAISQVNGEMLYFYWSLGRDIVLRKEENAYGSGFYEKLSLDLKKAIPDVKSFSPTNLRYMKWFYELYPNESIIVEKEDKTVPDKNLPQTGVNSKIDNLLKENAAFLIPWGHNKLIIDKCKGNHDKAIFYAERTLKNSWSRSVLLNFLESRLYEREGKAISNFTYTLPAENSDLAQQMTKDPYNFDFLTLRERYNEKDLKDALIQNVQRFLLELGRGFAFVGREYRLVVGKTEQYIDMLFYNITNHCYVVVEVKVGEFKPSDMGQLGTYIAAVDGILKGEQDNPTIGLLICKDKDNTLAKYAVKALNVPMGISEYQIKDIMPEEYIKSMPTIEELEEELKEITQ